MKEDIPRYWQKVLQALAYWIAYKKEYFHDHLLSEGAIVAELTQLLSANTDSNQRVECERMYKHFCTSISENIRADIVVGVKPEKTQKEKEEKKRKLISLTELTEVIEVKRYETDFKGIEKDFEKLDKLKILKTAKPSLRLFQVIVDQNSRPQKLMNENCRLFTRNIYTGHNGLDVRSRLSKRAYSTLNTKAGRGVHVVLLELL